MTKIAFIEHLSHEEDHGATIATLLLHDP